MYQWSPFGSGSPLGLLFAAAFAIPFGFLMTIPALRLQGLYLALASLAFARMAESLFFDQPEIFGTGQRNIARLSIFGYRFTDQRAYLLLVTAIFGVMAIGVVWLRRGRFGRRLVALRDSEAACATLGVNRFRTKLAVYALAAAMAGFAGALLGMQRGGAATQDFQLLSPLAIPIVLLIVVGGVETVSRCAHRRVHVHPLRGDEGELRHFVARLGRSDRGPHRRHHPVLRAQAQCLAAEPRSLRSAAP